MVIGFFASNVLEWAKGKDKITVWEKWNEN